MNLSWFRAQAWLVGLGLIFMAFYCAGWEFRVDTTRWFFFPDLGGIILIGVALYLMATRRLETGPRKFWIPIVIIYTFMILRTIIDAVTVLGNVGDLWVECQMAMTAVLVYAMGRYYGRTIFQPFVLFAAVASVLVVAATLYTIRDLATIGTGWNFFPWSYTWLATFIGMGGVLGAHTIDTPKRRYWFIGLCLAGLLLTRAPVAFILIAFLGVTMLWRRDYNRYIIIALAITGALFLVFWFGVLGGGGEERLSQVLGGTDNWGDGRLPAYQRALEEVSFFGHGFDRYSYQLQTGDVVVHQMPLIIVDQIGVLPALAWLFITGYLLYRSRYPYIWAAVLAFSALDYMLWTLFGYWWWAIVGVSSLIESPAVSPVSEYPPNTAIGRKYAVAPVQT